ncbi:MAG: hypothetical protein HY314_01165 [Acidobacteria bacterium]|nr:hypothetical protein [Acidobacteriota bacterium]
MTILDEDIRFHQRQRLEAWRIRFRQIGVEIGRSGMKDRNEIIPLLHDRRNPTFFTQDHGFYHPTLRHPRYCLVHLDVATVETADYIRRFLRHKAFRTQAQRMGKVIRVRHSGVTYWQIGHEMEHVIGW